jgi:hypothetical protein
MKISHNILRMENGSQYRNSIIVEGYVSALD